MLLRRIPTRYDSQASFPSMPPQAIVPSFHSAPPTAADVSVLAPPPPKHKKETNMSDERFVPERQKIDQLGVVKDYAVHPRLDYR